MRGDGVANPKRRRRDLQSDIVRTLATESEHSRPKETLEDSVLIGEETYKITTYTKNHEELAYRAVGERASAIIKQNAHQDLHRDASENLEDGVLCLRDYKASCEVFTTSTSSHFVTTSRNKRDKIATPHEDDEDVAYSSEVPSFDELKPQPQPLPNCPFLEVRLGDERGPELPIKPHSPDNFRMKVILDEESLEVLWIFTWTFLDEDLAGTHRTLETMFKISRKAHLLEDKQIPSVGVFDEVRHLEEIHVTLTQFGKKQDKIATLHEDDQDVAYSSWRRRHNFL
ncbi:hypothetical protein Tco_1123578 [Tanacetum coccineum]|uniref:Uncharacterized protein n=1 Tax=Tanacetum coccineum TaxID=301880 RepID=A0ABQ5J3S3_9ASTR